MNREPVLERPRLVTSFVAAILATNTAIGILAAVAGLFLSSGAPMELLAAAERACAERHYVSERQACMRQRLGAAHSLSMASK
jgi:hypothetical protein